MFCVACYLFSLFPVWVWLVELVCATLNGILCVCMREARPKCRICAQILPEIVYIYNTYNIIISSESCRWHLPGRSMAKQCFMDGYCCKKKNGPIFIFVCSMIVHGANEILLWKWFRYGRFSFGSCYMCVVQCINTSNTSDYNGTISATCPFILCSNWV